jgi:hypothetical protein
MEVPSDFVLARQRWTEEKARGTPYVTWKQGKPYIGERRLILRGEDTDALLRQEFRDVPPSIGYIRWYSLLNQRYVGLSRPTVEAFLGKQEAHLIYEPPRKIVASKAIIVTKPGRVWTADCLILPETTYRGRKCIGAFVIVDQMSKLVFAQSIKSTSMEEMIKVTGDFLTRLGDDKAKRVKVIRTDNGFGTEYTEWLKEKGITHTKGHPYRPQAQGLTERANRTLGSYLISWAEQKLGSKTRWPEVLDKAVESINNGWSRILKTSPQEIFDKDDDQPEIVERIRAEGKKRKSSTLYDDRLKPGEYVLVSMRADGPARIKSRIKGGTYKARDQQWVTDRQESVRKVVRRASDALYVLSDGLSYDRADLKRVPQEELEKYPEAA